MNHLGSLGCLPLFLTLSFPLNHFSATPSLLTLCLSSRIPLLNLTPLQKMAGPQIHVIMVMKNVEQLDKEDDDEKFHVYRPACAKHKVFHELTKAGLWYKCPLSSDAQTCAFIPTFFQEWLTKPGSMMAIQQGLLVSVLRVPGLFIPPLNQPCSVGVLHHSVNSFYHLLYL